MAQPTALTDLRILANDTTFRGNLRTALAGTLGLDASTVATRTSAKCFADVPATSMMPPDAEEGSAQPLPLLRLPAGVTVRLFGEDDEGLTAVEVALRTGPSSASGGADGDSGGERCHERCVRREFDVNGRLVAVSTS